MTSRLRAYTDEVWDRFFDFVFPCEDERTRLEVQAELRHRGIDARPAIARVKGALEARRARVALKEARATRPVLLKRLTGVGSSSGYPPAVEPALRASLRQIIAQLSGSQQAAYYHKLEKAASDDDLRSLLDDLHRLDALRRDDVDGGKTGE